MRPGKKCASDDNESNRASTATQLLLPPDAATKVSSEADRSQSQIHRESCCRKLKDNFVHRWGLNSMGLTTSRRCLHISKSEEEEEGDREEHNVKQSSSAARGDCDSTCSFLS